MNDFDRLIPADSYHKTKNLRFKPYSSRIQPFAEKQGNVIRIGIKESYPIRKKGKEIIKRGSIYQWTEKSRKRLLEKLLLIDLSKQYLYVALFTYSTAFKKHLTPKLIKKHRNKLLIYINRKYKNTGFVWKLEFTKKQMPHLHILITSPSPINIESFRDDCARIWFELLYDDFKGVLGDSSGYWQHIYNFANNEKNFQPMKSKGIISYFADYMTKYKNKEYQNQLPVYLRTEKDSLRFWGVSKGDNIITYEKEIIELNLNQYYNIYDMAVNEIRKTNYNYWNIKKGLTYYMKSEYGDIIDTEFVSLLFENACINRPCLNIQESTNKLKRNNKYRNNFILKNVEKPIELGENLTLF